MLEAARTGSDKFYLDITARGGLYPATGSRPFTGAVLRKVDITREYIPVFPCQLYLMGGIDVNIYGDTTVDRLYAAGKCSHTGVHGVKPACQQFPVRGGGLRRWFVRCTYDISRRLRHEERGVHGPPPAPPLREKPAAQRVPHHNPRDNAEGVVCNPRL